MKNIKKMTPYQMALFSPILTYIIRDLPKEWDIPLNVKFVALDRFPDEANNGWEVRGLGVGTEDMEYRSNQISIKWETMKAGYSEETFQKEIDAELVEKFFDSLESGVFYPLQSKVKTYRQERIIWDAL